MEACAPMPLMIYLDEITDPRRTGYAHKHDLWEMLVIAICAPLSDVDTFEDVTFWVTQQEAWLKCFLILENGIPSHDTFNRAFRILDPATFEPAFRRWVSGLVTAVSGTLVVDGKMVRRSSDGNARSIRMVGAFDPKLGIVLVQEKGARKSNEITVTPELLNSLLIKGYLVTIDALGCESEIAETIVAIEADYLLAAKGNQPKSLTTLQDRFALDQRDTLRDATCFERIEESHGRLVVQCAWVAPNTGEAVTVRWPICTLLATVESLRIVGGKPSDLERRYYISSRLMTAEACSKGVRGHWCIENRLHWMLDVNFGEDAAHRAQRLCRRQSLPAEKDRAQCLAPGNRNCRPWRVQSPQKAKARRMERFVLNGNLGYQSDS